MTQDSDSLRPAPPLPEVWIYAASKQRGTQLAQSLTELGFRSRMFLSGGPILPPAESRAAVRAPALILVAAGPGEPPPNDVCTALREVEELADIPLVLALEPEHLDATAALVGEHELVVRPYSEDELRTRVARARRSAGGAEGGKVVRVGALELNLVTHQVSVDGETIAFARMEYELLTFLATHPARVFSREALLKRVWGYDYYGGARTVDVHVRRLRAKLGPEQAARIKTVRSVGYLFEAGTPAPARLAAPPRRKPPSSAREPVRIGFVALTDAASVIMASELGLYEERGLDVKLVKQPSWPATRDALLAGELDAAHCLFSLPLSVATGIGGIAGTRTLKVAMMLNQNGQGITLKQEWADAGGDDLGRASAVLGRGQAQTYAMTFPGGTHDTWLRYWLKAMAIDSGGARIIPIPPAQMVANMQVGTMDAFCVGEPWNGVAVHEGVGFTELATQEIWESHPEKALVVNAGFAGSRPTVLKQAMGAILEASRWLDDPDNSAQAAVTLGRREYVGADPRVIHGRLTGVYDLGLGLGLAPQAFERGRLRFWGGGEVNFPRRGHAIWFLAQYVRFGYLRAEPSYGSIARELILTDLYKEVAEAEGVDVPDDDLAQFQIALDRVGFDPRRPQQEARRR